MNGAKLKMQRRSEELHLAVQEYLDVDWTSVKYYLRRQISKCVQECKSQATNAKRIARSIKKNHSSQSHEGVDFNGEYESGDDSDDWGSDFDSDSEEERKSDQLSFELNNNTIIDTVSGALERSSLSNAIEENSLSHAKSIPKPPDVPVISKIINNSNTNMKSSNHINIPRQPLKRPPSQPPPPPVSQASSHEEQQEDYEIPIVNAAVKENSCDQSLLNIPFEETSSIETYELIEPPEEEYEVVDAPPSQTILEKPILPPRHPTSSLNTSPPPLPQKPKKLKESLSVQERTDGIRTFSRSKIPGKAEEDSQTDIFQSSPTSGFISSLIGRRSSTPTSSPKSLHKSKDYNDTNSSSTASSSFSNENLSSHSLFLNKD
ncbi:protein IWS1 homolog, partial [Stegodyphus dumicola]|uniref:protein IWS1 homolog n=1 Tax=Stegodyphus dumicola TaxID=202533 RepID=UPI0015AA8544